MTSQSSTSGIREKISNQFVCDLEIAATELSKEQESSREENNQESLPSAADIGSEVEKELFHLCGRQIVIVIVIALLKCTVECTPVS